MTAQDLALQDFLMKCLEQFFFSLYKLALAIARPHNGLMFIAPLCEKKSRCEKEVIFNRQWCA